MATLLLGEVANGHSCRHHRPGPTAAKRSAPRRPAVTGQNWPPRRKRRPSSRASPRCASPTTRSTPTARRAAGGAAGRAGAGLRRHPRAFEPVREERAAARGGAARRDAALRHHQGARPQDLRAADLRRQRDPDRRIDRSEGYRHRAHRLLRGDGRGRRGADRAGLRRRRSRRLSASPAKRSRSPTARS